MKTLKRMILLANVEAKVLNAEYNTNHSVESFFSCTLKEDPSTHWKCCCDMYFNRKQEQ